jgi:Uma2 family endonuclease
MLAEKRRYTPEDLATIPNGDRCELVNGELVEKEMGALADFVASEILTLLRYHTRTNHLGAVFGAGAGYRCFSDAPDKVRLPDVSFVRTERLPEHELPEGYVGIAPDLAVESVSPHESHYQVLEKVGEYLAAGVRLVWVVLPRDRTVTVYRADGSVSWLRGDAEITGEEVVPGFRCSIREFFPATAANPS